LLAGIATSNSINIFKDAPDLIGVNKEKEPLSGTAPERRLFDRSLIHKTRDTGESENIRLNLLRNYTNNGSMI